MTGSSPNPGRARSGGELLVESLVAHRPSLFTCVPGESFLAVLDALYALRQAEDPRMPKLVTARHEAAAGNMAEAAGKLTGRAAVCFVTRGPGAAHASIALHTAYQDGTPLVLVVGQVTRALLGREAFQEMDYAKTFGSSAKAVVTLADAGRIPEQVARAWHTAAVGRPGPVVLVAPEDVLTDRSTAPVRVAPRVRAARITEQDQVELAEALRGAERPVIFVGGAGWTQRESDMIQMFAERNAVPLVTPFRWQDSVSNDSPAYAGYLGLGSNPQLRHGVREADLVVAVGPRLDDPTTDGFALSDEVADRLWLTSPTAAELCTTGIPAHGITAGTASVVDAIADLELPPSADRTAWFERLRRDQLAYQNARNEQTSPDLAEIVSTVREQTPDDAVITTGAGNYTVWVQRFYRFRRAGTQIAVRNGAMGYAVPAGLAAAALYPGRTVVTFAGDGCFLMSGNELATAVQHGLKVIIVVVNNGMFGTIRMHQERHYPGRVFATDLHNPDFVAYARSFGAGAYRAGTAAEFAEAFKAALGANGPILIEVKSDRRQLSPDVRL